MTQSYESRPYLITSPVDLLSIIQNIDVTENHQLYYLGLGSPADVANSGDQSALDIARNPLIALFFACIDNGPNDGEILIYHIPQNKVSRSFDYQDSDYLVLTERGTYIFVNNQQNNVELLAEDSINQQPLEIIINQSSKKYIIKELDKLGISIVTLFPEMA